MRCLTAHNSSSSSSNNNNNNNNNNKNNNISNQVNKSAIRSRYRGSRGRT